MFGYRAVKVFTPPFDVSMGVSRLSDVSSLFVWFFRFKWSDNEFPFNMYVRVLWFWVSIVANRTPKNGYESTDG